MNPPIVGTDAKLYIFDSGQWKLFACARAISLNVATEFIETSVAGAGLFATYLPTKNSFTGTLSGVVSLNNEGMLGLPDLRSRQISQTNLLLRFQRTDKLGNTYTDEANFFITNTSDTGAFDNVNVYDVAFQGTGLLTLLYTPILPVPPDGILVYRYEYTATGGEYGFTDSALINKIILEASADGISDGKILFNSGTPVGNEVKYIQATGQFIWGIPFEPGEEIYILYQPS